MSLKEQIKQEGDFEQGEILGFPFTIWRHKSVGHWCGYVAVPKDSRLDGKKGNYYTESENGLSRLEQAINDMSVHGGITFTGKAERFGNDLWHFGFDCGHSGDLEPFMIEDYPELANGVYRDKKYVMTEVENLARQLKEILDLKL